MRTESYRFMELHHQAEDVSCPRPALTRARDESDSEDELPPVTEMMRCEEAEVGGPKLLLGASDPSFVSKCHFGR